jgi:hypothetical protein
MDGCFFLILAIMDDRTSQCVTSPWASMRLSITGGVLKLW